MKIQLIQLQAGQTYTHVVNGLYFRVLTADVAFEAVFQLQSGRVEKTEVKSGLGFGFPEPFVQAQITSTVTQIIEIVTSAVPVDDSRLAGTISITNGAQVIDYADISCPNGAATVVLAANAARKTALIGNLDAANAVRVGGSGIAANMGTPLEAGLVWSADVTGEIRVFNSSGVAVNVSRQEITA